MKKIKLSLVLITISIMAYSQEILIASNCCEGGKCVGSSNCTACKNCTGCKHCAKEGGTCGACKPKNSNNIKNTNSTNTTSEVIYKYRMSLFVQSETLNLREEPNTKAEIKEELKKGDELLFIDTYGDWLKVEVLNSSKTGYVFKKYVK